MPLILLTNTYLDVDSNYLTTSSDWNAATVEEKEQALLLATEKLDNNSWLGYALSTSQPLAWPRTAFSFYDPVLRLDVPVPEGTLPVRLLKSVAKLAIYYVKFPSAGDKEVTYDKIKIGPIELENTSLDGSKNSSPAYPSYDSVQGLIEPLLDKPSLIAKTWWRAN